MIILALPLGGPVLGLAVYPGVSLLKTTVVGIPTLLKLMAKTPKCFDETCLVLNSRLILQFVLLLEGKYPNLHSNIWDQMEQLLKYRKYICFGVSMHTIYNSRALQNKLYTVEIWDLIQKQSNCVVQVSALMREVITSSDLSVHCGNMQWNHFLTNKINLHSSSFLRMICKLIYKVNRCYERLRILVYYKHSPPLFSICSVLAADN